MSIFHDIQVGISQGRRKASAHRNRANVVRRTIPRTIPKKSSTDGGSNVEKFDEPASRRGTKTGKKRVKK